MLKNKNGNIVYNGSFAGVRYSRGKFYAHFSYGIKEVPKGDDGHTKICDMSIKEFEKLPRVDGLYETN